MFAVSAGFTSAVWCVVAAADPAEVAPLDAQRIPHAFVTPDELANPQLYHPRLDREYLPPQLPNPAPPPDGSIRPGEFDEMDSVIIAPLNYGASFVDMYEEMVVAYAAAGHVWIIASDSYRALFEPRLQGAGVPSDAYSYLNYPVDTIWIRDYGPEFAVDPEGVRHMWDADYGSTRPLDDAIPLLMAAGDWMSSDGAPMDVMVSTEHGLSGGNIMSDGAGTCFFSDIVYGYEKPAGWTQDDVDALMQEYLGCEKIIVLNPICLDGTGHIDLYAKVMAPTSILLGQYPADTHFAGATESGVGAGYCATPHTPNDYQDQEDNLAILEASTNVAGDPWTITRLPMPEPYYDGAYWVYRSYMNSQVFNGAVAMPSYYDPQGDETADDLLDMEAAAIAAYEAAAPGVVVTPIDSDHIIGMAGAMHCITHEIPAEAGGGWVAPDAYCGDGVVNGGEECDGDDFGDTTCADYGLGLGPDLLCGTDCMIDTSGCPGAECGNGVVDEGEECDPCVATGVPCSDVGFGDGEAGCSSECVLTFMACPDATTPCELVALSDPGLVCCPEGMAQDCDADTWSFTPHDSYYGCCTPDMTVSIWCEGGEFVSVECAGTCGYVSGGYIDCESGEPPAEFAPVEGCPDDEPDAGTDAGPDPEPGKSDDDCGCAAAGASSRPGLLSLLFS
jgi:agmatine/peptidylarginine deiminase